MESRLLALKNVPDIVRPSSTAPGPQPGERMHVWMVSEGMSDTFCSRLPDFLIPVFDRNHSKYAA